jgi:hypothetical protein
VWWDPPWPGRGRTLRDAVHRLRERRALRSRDDPDEEWRCCELWPRTLLNKWNAREFAARHGCPVPVLYWAGSDHSRVPYESLPARFVIRPMFGAKRIGVAVVVDGEDRMWGGSASPRELRAKLPRSRLGRPVPILVEEFVEPHDPTRPLPLEIKLHAFGSEVAAVQVTDRRAAREARSRWYTPDWEPIRDLMNDSLPVDELRDRPESLEQMVDLATRIGTEIATYMRIDLFVTDGGFSLNEFSSLPLIAPKNTPYCDQWFGELWAEHCPDTT